MWGIFLVLFALGWGLILNLSMLAAWWLNAITWIAVIRWWEIAVGIALHLGLGFMCYMLVWFCQKR